MRGGIGYVVMMVLNPIIILFYQNCSVVPSASTRAIASEKTSVTKAQRGPASISVASSNLKDCPSQFSACPQNLE